MSNIDKQELREAAERAESDSWGYDRDEFNEALTPSTVLALLDELEAAEKCITELEALAVGMEQEPVAEISQAQEYDLEGNLRHQRDIDYYQDDIDKLPVGTKLYAAPQLPQTAVAITQHFDTIALDTAKMVMCDVNRRDEFLGGDIQLLSRIQCRIDEACRAAMLHGAEPVTDNTNQQFESLSMVKK